MKKFHERKKSSFLVNEFPSTLIKKSQIIAYTRGGKMRLPFQIQSCEQKVISIWYFKQQGVLTYLSRKDDKTNEPTFLIA